LRRGKIVFGLANFTWPDSPLGQASLSDKLELLTHLKICDNANATVVLNEFLFLFDRTLSGNAAAHWVKLTQRFAARSLSHFIAPR
jgi:hypothetical protein